MKQKPVILGIIAEYDPFHNGHAYHLNRARKVVHPDTVYVALSPCMKQRGELSLLSPYARAACALHAGADAVFSLPVLWTVRDAENYALGAVSMLCGLGITHIAFGAETDQLDLLQQIADFLSDPPSGFQEELKYHLSCGNGYPAALCRSVSSYMSDAAEILSFPNNILGICYLRALKKLHKDIIPVIIPRRGNYHGSVVDPVAPSASAIRQALIRGAYSSAFQAMPEFSAGIVRRAFLSQSVPDSAVWDCLLIRKLRSSDLSLLPDLSEGLEDGLKKAAASASSAQDLIARLTTRRYTAARITRLCAMAILNATEERFRSLSLPDVSLLLALRKEKVPTDRWNDLPVRIVSASVWRTLAAPEDSLCWQLWADCCHRPETMPYTERIYTE